MTGSGVGWGGGAAIYCINRYTVHVKMGEDGLLFSIVAVHSKFVQGSFKCSSPLWLFWFHCFIPKLSSQRKKTKQQATWTLCVEELSLNHLQTLVTLLTFEQGGLHFSRPPSLLRRIKNKGEPQVIKRESDRMLT